MEKTEDQIQAEIYKWFHNEYCTKFNNPRCCIFAVPNGGLRSKHEAMKLKSTGVVAGVSDLIVLLPNRCLFIEVKTDVGRQSDKQKEFEQIVKKLGFDYQLVRSLDDFLTFINVYIN
jgi:hypothetical protein